MASNSAISSSSSSQLKGAVSKYNKVFVGGLSWATSEADFVRYFSKFGDVKEAVIMKDKATGKSRGFGFVAFSDPASVDKVMQAKDQIELDGRTVDCKVAVPKDQISNPEQVITKKLFIGGIPSAVTEGEFKNHFSQFGRISHSSLMVDKASGRSRGFGFVTFDSQDAVDLVLSKEHTLGGKSVECKKAIPKTKLERDQAAAGVRPNSASQDPFGFPPDALYRDPYGYSAALPPREPVYPPRFEPYPYGYGVHDPLAIEASYAAPPPPPQPEAYAPPRYGAPEVYPPSGAEPAPGYAPPGYAPPAYDTSRVSRPARDYGRPYPPAGDDYLRSIPGTGRGVLPPASGPAPSARGSSRAERAYHPYRA
jgi:RNA recognition motif-containing protein